MLREEVRELSDRLTGDIYQIGRRVNELGNVVNGILEAREVEKLGGKVKAGQGSCEYVDDGRKHMDVYFGPAGSPYPIRRIEHNVDGYKKAEITGNVPALHIRSTKNSMDITITQEFEKALKHFAPIVPFAHFTDEVLSKLRAYLPITENDHLKCRKILVLLADNPPARYEGLGAQWFRKFHEDST
ncbi:hypothetical protein FOZ63_014655, partial [Perkinsus olseni]